MKLDAHQHFWQISRGDYGWLTEELQILYRDYTPADLTPLLQQCGIDGTLLVQAAPTASETDYLLRLANENSFIKGVVGWVDFETTAAAADIRALSQQPKLVGLRPMIQDIDDVDWMLRPQLAPAFEALIASDLCFDALVLPKHLSNLLTLLKRYPDMRVVVDHGAKPQIAENRLEEAHFEDGGFANGGFDEWASGMSRIANETSAFCKLSGLVTEASADWNSEDLEPYINHLINSFGAKRLIWGSDWPVAKLAVDYPTWFQLALSYFPEPSAQAQVFGQNAMRAYKLPVSC